MALEVVAMFARWWDNFQESCDIRLAVGCGCAVAWVLLVAISPVLSTASTFIGAGLSWRSGIVVGGVLAFGLAAIAWPTSWKTLRRREAQPFRPAARDVRRAVAHRRYLAPEHRRRHLRGSRGALRGMRPCGPHFGMGRAFSAVRLLQAGSG